MIKHLFLSTLLIVTCNLSAEYSYVQAKEKLEELAKGVTEEKITKSDALLSIEETDIELLLKPSIKLNSDESPLFTGFVACKGAAVGSICFESKNLKCMKETNGSVIWVTKEITNDDLCYIKYADAIVAFKEDPSSHAIIVTRINNVPCITLVQGATLSNAQVKVNELLLKEGDTLSVDAFNGWIYNGEKELVTPSDCQILDVVMDWADQYTKLSVHAGADTIEEAKAAVENGAKGIDPRSEHMFFEPENLQLFRRVILQKEEGAEALEELKAIQKKDILGLFQTMQSYPVKFRSVQDKN